MAGLRLTDGSDIVITLLLPFRTVPYITARSLWNVQYGCMFCFTSTLVWGQLLMMYTVSTCRFSSFCVASHISYVDMHSGMSMYVFIALIFSFMLGISWSLFFAVVLS